ncbi:MAG TPA: helix-turn-helix transcriptional regulator [Candidatus Woesebacteria bacterium]|nr:helix-turn-helix transcriptional regulator [Candidatus Woesebacteria bacterium]
MDKSPIAKNIKRARKKLGLTQEQLAVKAGIPYATLSKIESGQVTNPTVSTLKKIADALNISVDDILN